MSTPGNSSWLLSLPQAKNLHAGSVGREIPAHAPPPPGPWLDQERNFLATSWHQAWEAPRAQQVVYGKWCPGFCTGREPAQPSLPLGPPGGLPRGRGRGATSPPPATRSPLGRPHVGPQIPQCHFILGNGVGERGRADCRRPDSLGPRGSSARSRWSQCPGRPGHGRPGPRLHPRRHRPRCPSRRRHPPPSLAC